MAKGLPTKNLIYTTNKDWSNCKYHAAKTVMFIHSRIFSLVFETLFYHQIELISVRQRPGISYDTVVAHRCLLLGLKLGLIQSGNSLHCKRRKSFLVSYGTRPLKQRWKTLELQTYIISSEYFQINACNVRDINSSDFWEATQLWFIINPYCQSFNYYFCHYLSRILTEN